MSASISLTEISDNWNLLSPSSKWYENKKEVLRGEIREATNASRTELRLEGIGLITLPVYSMGQITSVDLFGLDEIVLFSFYQQRKERGVAIGLGANIGLHTIVLSKLGYEVLAVEPDPKHIEQITTNLQINNVQNVSVMEKAVSSETGFAEFVRVKGNTTGSHLAGSRGKEPYGEIDKFQVETIAISELLSSQPNVTLVKMDVEGCEAELICSLESHVFTTIDFVLEVGSHESALLIYDFLKQKGLSANAQKIGWEKVAHLENMPKSYKDGSLIIPKQKVT